MSSTDCCTNANEAGKTGHLRCLQTICSKRGFTWDSKHHKGACLLASRHGRLDCLKYAREKGCPLDDISNLQVEDYLHDKNAVNAAIVGGHLECLKYAHQEARIELTEDAFIAAAVRGRLNCLVYLREQGLEWYSETIAICARYGHLECLTYALENGAPYLDGTFDLKDESGEGEIDNYPPEALAAHYGHLECLKYLCEKKVVKTNEIIDFAMQSRELDCARYLIEHTPSEPHCVYMAQNYWTKNNRLTREHLEDPVWRHFLFHVAIISEAPLVERIVNKKKKEIQQIKDECTCLISEGKMSSDVLQYIMYLYI